MYLIIHVSCIFAFLLILVFLFKGMAVGTVAQAMAIDAYSKYTSESTDPANSVIIMNNAAIYRTVEVNITHCCHFSF